MSGDKEMSCTPVTDITINLIGKWFYHLKFVSRLGFKINFARAHFKRIVHAFLGVQANRLKDGALKRRICKEKREV